jgi:hypothetical protein
MTLSRNVCSRADLQCWVDNLKLGSGKKFFPDAPDLEIFTDASLSGWAAYCCNGVRTRGSWTWAESKRHITELELLGAMYAVQAFAVQSSNISIRIYLDNVSVMTYINHGGGAKSRRLTAVSSAFVNWCESREIALEAVYVKGKLNVIADEESRVCLNSGD